MACGCGKNKGTPRRVIPVNQPAGFNPTIRPTVQPTTNMADNRAAAINGNPVTFERRMMNSDRLRIERLRREAINNSRGNNS